MHVFTNMHTAGTCEWIKKMYTKGQQVQGRKCLIMEENVRQTCTWREREADGQTDVDINKLT